MNFFGHAVVASWISRDPAYVLGAMLPDLANMIRSPLPALTDARLREGVHDHKLVDRVFHDMRTFRKLCAYSFEQLRHLGVDRGRSRAAAHVGIEILLDEVLARDPTSCQHYAAALEQAAPDELGARMGWLDGDQERFERLRLRLQRRSGVPDVVTPEVLAYRLDRAFGGRTRLAMGLEDLELVRKWAPAARRQVAADADHLIHELVSELSHAGMVGGHLTAPPSPPGG